MAFGCPLILYLLNKMRYTSLTLFLGCALGVSSAVGQVKVSAGTSVVVNGGAQVNLRDLSLDYGFGMLAGAGHWVFSGAGNSEVRGATPLVNLSLAKNVGSRLALGSDLAVQGSVDFVSGYLELNGFNLNLGNTGLLLNERNESYVTGAAGYIYAGAVLNAPSAVDPGNLGLSITSGSNLGATSVRRGNYPLSDASHQSVGRFFEVEPANNTNLDATLRFRYFNRELNGLQEDLLRLMRSGDDGLTWSALANATVNTALDYVEATGVNSLGKLSLINEFTLPLSSLKLSARAQKRGVSLQWLTVNEVGVDHFRAERSQDGKRFLSFAELGSKSVLNRDNSYTLDDVNPLLGLNYYRITAVDSDGKTSESNIIPVNFALAREEQASIYPNPAVRTINGTFYMGAAQGVKLSVVSSIGKVELRRELKAMAGLNHFSFDVSLLASGVYVVQIASATINQQLKFIKN